MNLHVRMQFICPFFFYLELPISLPGRWRCLQHASFLSGGEWSTNGTGLRVSHKFGFGAIDAEAMVTRAKRWINVPPQHNITVYPSTSYGYVTIICLQIQMHMQAEPHCSNNMCTCTIIQSNSGIPM